MGVNTDIINPGHAYPARAGAVIDKYDCVTGGTAEDEVIKTSGANLKILGFVHTGKATAAGQGISVYISGFVWGRSAAAISRAAYLESAADGEVVTETPASGVDQEIGGVAYTAAAGANELLAVQIRLFKYDPT